MIKKNWLNEEQSKKDKIAQEKQQKQKEKLQKILDSLKEFLVENKELKIETFNSNKNYTIEEIVLASKAIGANNARTLGDAIEFGNYMDFLLFLISSIKTLKRGLCF